MSASDYLELEVLDHVLGKGTRDFPSPTTLAVALFTVMPNDAGTGGTEVANLYGYARQSATFATASAGSSSTSADLTYGPASGGAFGTIVGVGIYDSLTHGAGNPLIFATLAVDKTVSDGDTFVISSGNLTVNLA
tara:strand:- start:1986 stop:2390 length:405 start_codon:yes stop_codon:yes gene_type:complete